MHFSEVEKKESNHSRSNFFHIDDQFMLFLSDRDKKEIVVHVYDSALRHKSRSILELVEKTPLIIKLINNVPVLFSTIINSKGEKELYSHNISNEGLLSSTLLITKYKNLGGNVVNYKIAISKNSKHIIVFIEHPFEKEKHEKISIVSLNSDFNVKSNYDHTLEFIHKHKTKNVPIVSNNGTVYILKRYWDKGNKYYLGIQKGSQFLKTELRLRSRKIADIKYAFSANNELLLGGFYTSPVRFNFEGVFTFRFNNSIHPDYRKEVFLAENIVSTFKHKKEIKEKGYGLDHFKAKDLLLDTLGNQYLIAEHHFIEKHNGESIHDRKGIVVFKFTKSGSYVWGAPVLLEQKEKSKLTKWTSSAPFMINNNFHFMYNNTGNEKASKIDHIYGANSLYGTNIVSFNQSGVLQNQPFFGMHEGLKDRFAFSPKIILQEEQDVYILTENAEKDNFRIVKISFY